MTITDGIIIPETRAEIVFYGWEVHRRTQDVPFPSVGGGTVLKAQSRLFRLTEPYASGREPLCGADLTAIENATASLIEAVRAYCGDSAAAKVSGQDGSVAA